MSLSRIAPSERGSGIACRARRLGGRVVEVYVDRLADLGDVAALNACVGAAIVEAGPGAVICADHRRPSLMSHDVADAWSRSLRRNNGVATRAGVLLDPANAAYNAQVQRVLRCAGNADRRCFTDLDELRAWVGETLAESERRAMEDLFADGLQGT